jgi:signal transduction histidine kinase/CheY-like chemotaxis protein
MPREERHHTANGASKAHAAIPIVTTSVRVESDVVSARQRARQIAALLGFDVPQQTRIATAVSEIARNAFKYAGGGCIEFSVEGKTSPQILLIRIIDTGPGVADLDAILEGRFRSSTGMGVGITGARRLMDQFDIQSSAKGTAITLKKLLPRKATVITPQNLPALADALSRQKPENTLDEMQQQNRELMATLDELVTRQEDLVRLNRELEDTNRGVVALYAELDEKADHLRRADEVKSRFLSNMSHEFRTPLNSILALSRLLLDRTDGDLTPDQERQVHFIRRSAENLFELVNDLLDLAKVEAGKIVVRPTEFDVRNLFGALRGMLRPLLLNAGVNLVFDEPEDIPPMYTDEGKVSQILRNFISNALKFTEHGEVRVSAHRKDSDVIFSVADTGIGIAEGDLERIFQEFTQIENPIQHKVKGTGLGLPLSRKLAELLGGNVGVRSSLGSGSIFTAAIPLTYPAAPLSPLAEAPPVDMSRIPVLIVEDQYETRLVYERYLKGDNYQAFFARSVAEARRVIGTVPIRAIVLDMLLEGEDAWGLLAALKSSAETSNIPVIVVTTIEDTHKGYGLGAEEYAVKPVTKEWFLSTLARVIEDRGARRILVIDDDEVFRYLVRQLFSVTPHYLLETAGGAEGLALAREKRPDLIILDLVMPGLSGFEVLRLLRGDAELSGIPVIVATSKVLTDSERQQVADGGGEILSKEKFSSGDVADDMRQILARMNRQDLFAARERES